MSIPPLGEADQARVIDILVSAFRDDPVMNWMSSHPDFLPTFFRITLPVFFPHGLTYLDARERGAAAWLGPGQQLAWPLTPGNLWRMLRVCGPAGFTRFARAGISTGRYHPSEPHYYLFAIGAVPEARGQGVGSALISRVLRRCDAENIPAYLENSKRENLAFYQGHGFSVLREIRFASGAPPLWLMWRPPQTGS